MHPTILPYPHPVGQVARLLALYEPELTRLEARIALAQGRLTAEAELAERYLANGWGPYRPMRDWQAVSDRLLARHRDVLAIVEGLHLNPPVFVADPEVVKYQEAYERGLVREAAAMPRAAE